MIDFTWATSELYRRIPNWRVTEGVETLSDHLYILMEVANHETTSAVIQTSSPRGANVSAHHQGGVSRRGTERCSKRQSPSPPGAGTHEERREASTRKQKVSEET